MCHCKHEENYSNFQAELLNCLVTNNQKINTFDFILYETKSQQDMAVLRS
jgi:hypothetical protein